MVHRASETTVASFTYVIWIDRFCITYFDPYMGHTLVPFYKHHFKKYTRGFLTKFEAKMKLQW